MRYYCRRLYDRRYERRILETEMWSVLGYGKTCLFVLQHVGFVCMMN
jgi:hypothetical protein